MRLPYSFVLRFLFDGVRTPTTDSVVRGFRLRGPLRRGGSFHRFRFWFVVPHEIIDRGDFRGRAATDDAERISRVWRG